MFGLGAQYRGGRGVTRDFVATALIAWEGRAALLLHAKLGRWLPPGGHIEAPELPELAAVREAREELGIDIEIVAEYEPAGFSHALARPAGVQLEDIEPGHQHIDLLYYARPLGGTALAPNEESLGCGWFTPDEMRGMRVDAEVVAWCEKAIRAVAEAAKE